MGLHEKLFPLSFVTSRTIKNWVSNATAMHGYAYIITVPNCLIWVHWSSSRTVSSPFLLSLSKIRFGTSIQAIAWSQYFNNKQPRNCSNFTSCRGKR